MNAHRTDSIRAHLGERDHAILVSLERFRLLNTHQVQRLHFADHATDLAAARSCNRALRRLQQLGLISALERRIGGVRRGSASYVWQLAATGERYLRSTRGQAQRRRFLEPSTTFLKHTLAVNDIVVSLLEADRTIDHFTVEQLTTEPANWRSYLGPSGETRWLKPDLYVVTAHEDHDGDYEAHTFLEIDLGTEHLPRIQAKCQMYAAYARTGAYQAQHAMFPAVIWLSADPARRRALRAAAASTQGLTAGLFRVTSTERYLARLLTREGDAK